MSSRSNRAVFVRMSAMLPSAIRATPPARTICVHDAATAAYNSTSWADARPFLQESKSDWQGATNQTKAWQPRVRVANGNIRRRWVGFHRRNFKWYRRHLVN
jgi:hypothetical protein